MGIKNLLCMVVMVTIPGPSLQALSECSYQSTDVHVLFEASTSATKFIGGISNYLQQIQGIAKDAVSTSPVSRVSLTAFTSDGPREYVAINSGLTSSQVDKTIRTVSTTQLGGTIADALSYMIKKNIMSASNGNHISLVVIFTSALKDLSSVKSYLDMLTAAKVNVQLFPVGMLAFNSASHLPHVKKVISNVINFGQTVTDNVFQCNGMFDGFINLAAFHEALKTAPLNMELIAGNPSTGTGSPNDLCSGWHGGETGLFPYAGRCDKFYQCSHKVAYPMQCPFGQLYDKGKMVCDHPHLVLQSPTSGCDYCQYSNSAVYPYSDSCELYYQCGTGKHGSTLLPRCCPADQGFVEGVGCQFGAPCTQKNYTHHGSCRNYYQCVDGDLAMRCCPDGQGFDRYTGYCTSSLPYCNTPCIGDPPVCNHKPSTDSICEYITVVHGREIPRPCPDRHAWDQSICDCSNAIQGAENCGIQPEACDPDFVTDMDIGGQWGFADGSGTFKYIGNDYVDFPGQYGEFKNGAFLTVYHFQNIDWPKPFWARVIFQCDSGIGGNDRQVLLSNGCYNSDPGQATIDMTVNPSTRTVTAGVKTNITKVETSLQWMYNTRPETWLQATMRYDGKNLDLNVKDTLQASSSVSDSVPASGQILQSPCALRIGRGNNGEKTFNGRIDDISIYSTCTYPPSVDSPSD